MTRRREHGMMMVWALLALAIVMGLLFAGLERLRANSVDATSRFRVQGQALDVARAGIVDAYAWFRRQTVQPVTNFAPQRDLTAIPPVNETDDPSIGIVREFEATPGYWARYEVRLFDDRNGNGRSDAGEGVFDATTNRAVSGSGTTWHLESRGFVYRRLAASVPWNVEPNRRVAGALVSTEIRRMSLAPPAASALCVSRGDRATIGARGRVDGDGSAGVVFPATTGAPSVAGELVGAPPSGSIPGYDASVAAVFGDSIDELKASASVRVPGGGTLPDPFPEDSLVFVEGNLTVTSASRLRGSGILVVNGDLLIASGSNAYFTGLIYVTGNYTQRSPSMVRGTVIVGGTANVTGASDFAELVYDHSVLDALLQTVGRYRITRALHRLDFDAIGGVR